MAWAHSQFTIYNWHTVSSQWAHSQHTTSKKNAKYCGKSERQQRKWNVEMQYYVENMRGKIKNFQKPVPHRWGR